MCWHNFIWSVNSKFPLTSQPPSGKPYPKAIQSLKDRSSRFSVDYLGLISLQKCYWIYSWGCISHHGWGDLNLCLDYWKMHLQVKKLEVEIFTHRAKFFPRFLSSPPSKHKEITHFPWTAFFGKSTSPAERGRKLCYDSLDK